MLVAVLRAVHALIGDGIALRRPRRRQRDRAGVVLRAQRQTRLRRALAVHDPAVKDVARSGQVGNLGRRAVGVRRRERHIRGAALDARVGDVVHARRPLRVVGLCRRGHLRALRELAAFVERLVVEPAEEVVAALGRRGQNERGVVIDLIRAAAAGVVVARRAAVKHPFERILRAVVVELHGHALGGPDRLAQIGELGVVGKAVHAAHLRLHAGEGLAQAALFQRPDLDVRVHVLTRLVGFARRRRHIAGRIHVVVLHREVHGLRAPARGQRHALGDGLRIELTALRQVPANKVVVRPRRVRHGEALPVAEGLFRLVRERTALARVKGHGQRLEVEVQAQREAAVARDHAARRAEVGVERVVVKAALRRNGGVRRAVQRFHRRLIQARIGVLLVAGERVRCTRTRRPDRRVGAVALRHGLRQRGRPAERVARLRHRQRGRGDALAPAPGGDEVRLARVLKGQGIGIARVVDAQHERAVRGDGAALDRALVLRILMVARNGLHDRFNGRAGRAGQVLGLRGGVGIAAIRVLEVVFDLVRRVLSGLPLGIERQAAHRHRAAGKGVLTRRVGVPAAEHIAGLDRLRQRGEAHARAEVHLLRLPAALRQRSAVRLKPEVAACAVVVQLHDGLAVRADRRRGHGAAIHLRVIVGEAVLAPRAEVDRESGRTGPALDGLLVVDEQIALHAVHTLRVALDAVRRVVARQPLRRKAHVARDRHAASAAKPSKPLKV